METAVKSALDRGGVVDITTLGAKSGMDRRIEINFITLDGNHYITGNPGRKRDWLANMKANPEFTIHLVHGLSADLQAEATEITSQEERADVLYRILTESWGNPTAKADHLLPRWVEGAPLVEFTIV